MHSHSVNANVSVYKGSKNILLGEEDGKAEEDGELNKGSQTDRIKLSFRVLICVRT